MNTKTAAQLLALMEVKTQLEKTGHAALEHKQKKAFEEADALKHNAASASPAATDDSSSMGLRHAAAYSARLLSDARQKRRDGEALEIEKQQKRNQLRSALQREIAADRLLKEAQNYDRKQRENIEESSREQALTARPRAR